MSQISSAVEQPPCKRLVVGSIPTSGSIKQRRLFPPSAVLHRDAGALNNTGVLPGAVVDPATP